MATTSEAAQILHVSERHIRGLSKRKILLKDGRASISRASLENYLSERKQPGRPSQQANSLAAMLRGEKPQSSPRTIARLRQLIRNGTAHELAFMLRGTADEELNSLAKQEQNGGLEGRAALKQLRDLQLNWIACNPAKTGSMPPIALTGLRSSAQIAAIVREAPDSMAIRLISDYIGELQAAPREHVLALTSTPAPSTGDPNHDALLAAGTAWATRKHQLPTPQWTITRRAPQPLWNELAGTKQEEWIPEFKERNIFAIPKFFGKGN